MRVFLRPLLGLDHHRFRVSVSRVPVTMETPGEAQSGNLVFHSQLN